MDALWTINLIALLRKIHHTMRICVQSTIFLMPEGTLIRTTYKNNKQKPPFVPNSTKSGFLSSYFRSKEPCGSLFRQVLFVLERVPDVLDYCALNPYEPLLIVWLQYTIFQILSQVRYYFISTLSISVRYLSAIWFFSSNRLSQLFRSKRLRPLLFLRRLSLFQSKMLFHPHLYFLPIKPPF